MPAQLEAELKGLRLRLGSKVFAIFWRPTQFVYSFEAGPFGCWYLKEGQWRVYWQLARWL